VTGQLASDALPFDDVHVSDARGERVLTAKEFFQLPLSQRLRHVIAKTATFMRDGEVVDAQTALAQRRADRIAS
jgi:hypothetical protein